MSYVCCKLFVNYKKTLNINGKINKCNFALSNIIQYGQNKKLYLSFNAIITNQL